jgi:hypothetical protein
MLLSGDYTHNPRHAFPPHARAHAEHSRHAHADLRLPAAPRTPPKGAFWRAGRALQIPIPGRMSEIACYQQRRMPARYSDYLIYDAMASH